MRCALGMKYSIGVAAILVLFASPLPVSAEPGEEGSSSESGTEEAAPASEPEEDAPDIDTLSQRAIEHYESQSTGDARTAPSAPSRRSVARHRRGLIASSVVFGLGIGAIAGSVALSRTADCGDDDPATLDLCIPTGPIVLATFATMLTVGGLVGMAISGSRLSKSRSKLREQQRAHDHTSRRAQWDVAGSRLVF